MISHKNIAGRGTHLPLLECVRIFILTIFLKVVFLHIDMLDNNMVIDANTIYNM